MTDRFEIALHTWTIDTTPIDVAFDAAKRAGYDCVELRRSDVVRSLEAGQSLEQVIATIRDSGMRLGILGTEYGWFFAGPAEQRRLFGVLRETCEMARHLGCGFVMSAPGQVVGTVGEAIAATKIAGEIVGEYGLKLALEFNSQHDVVNRTDVLREIIAGAGHAHCGMLLDAYHLHRSGGIAKGLDGVRAEELFVFQFSDVPADPVAGIRRPIDRLMPGDGVLDWQDVFGRLEAMGYRGPISLEAPNPVYWARSPYDVAEEGMRKTRAFLPRQTTLA